MKIRNGFVSNSSSSSFVILGFKSNECVSNTGKFRSTYVEFDDADYVTGVVIADSDEYLEDAEVGDIQEKINEIAEFFDKDPSEIKLYCGTRMS